jgi:RNA polymerase sigma factor (sigma-70 family)
MQPGPSNAFPVTRYSVVRAMTSVDPEARREAYAALVRGYWRPVYAYIRLRWHRAAEDAKDLTQEFFTRALEKEYLAKYDPSKARFRTFVRTCLDGFLANEAQAAGRRKRGGGVLLEPVDFASADDELVRHMRCDDQDPEIWFRREWIRSLFATAIDELRSRCEGTDRSVAFVLFRQYDIDGSDTSARPTYAALARDLDRSVTDVTNQLAWARRAFRDIVLERVRAVCATEEEFRAEARDVLGITL